MLTPLLFHNIRSSKNNKIWKKIEKVFVLISEKIFLNDILKYTITMFTYISMYLYMLETWDDKKYIGGDKNKVGRIPCEWYFFVLFLSISQEIPDKAFQLIVLLRRKKNYTDRQHHKNWTKISLFNRWKNINYLPLGVLKM